MYISGDSGRGTRVRRRYDSASSVLAKDGERPWLDPHTNRGKYLVLTALLSQPHHHLGGGEREDAPDDLPAASHTRPRVQSHGHRHTASLHCSVLPRIHPLTKLLPQVGQPLAHIQPVHLSCQVCWVPRGASGGDLLGYSPEDGRRKAADVE